MPAPRRRVGPRIPSPGGEGQGEGENQTSTHRPVRQTTPLTPALSLEGEGVNCFGALALRTKPPRLSVITCVVVYSHELVQRREDSDAR